MTDVRGQLAGGWGLVRRDLQLFLSYRLRVVWQLLAITMSVTLFYYVSRLVNVAAFPDPDDYFASVVVALAVVELLTAALSTTPLAVRNELLAGTFERLVVSPLGPVASIAAMMVFPILLAFAVGTVTLLLSAVVFGLEFDGLRALLALPAALLGAAAFVPFAFAMVAILLILKQAAAATAFLVTGLSLSSGAFFPSDLLPAPLSWVADLQPLTPALELLRHLVIGLELDGSAWWRVLKLAGWAIIGLGPSLLLVQASIARCRQRGTLVEY